MLRKLAVFGLALDVVQVVGVCGAETPTIQNETVRVQEHLSLFDF
jgi:hypothetical protein